MTDGAQSDEPPVLVEDRGEVRWVMLNRPAARNAQNEALLTALTETFAQTRESAARVLVLAGAGTSFSAGHDIKEAAFNPRYRSNIETVEGRFRQERDLFVRPIELLRALPIPTICRLQGHCMAAALMLVGACDLVVAAEDARFSSTVTRDMGAADVEVPWLYWALGERRAKQMTWLSESIGARDALALGIVNWVVPNDELDAKLQSVLDELLRVPREALELSKLSLRFMEDRRGRADVDAYHFLSHQLSHHTTETVELLRRRVADLERRLRERSAAD
jgi:enoyl-CoA hydratase/carnithine racemase